MSSGVRNRRRKQVRLLQKLDYEGHSLQFWNLQPKIRVLNQTRFATEISQADDIARALRMQRDLSSLRSVWLESSVQKPLQRCQVCGAPLAEQKTRPRRLCSACHKTHRRNYWQTRYSENKTNGESLDKVKRLVNNK